MGLHNPPFEFGRFAQLRGRQDTVDADSERADLVTERTDQVRDAGQELVLERLLGVGANVLATFWTDNTIRVDVPARWVKSIVDWPEVVGIAYENPEAIELPENDGFDIQHETLVDNFLEDGIDARDGHYGGTPRVRIAVLESAADSNDFMRKNHPAFLDTAGGSTRVETVYNCTPSCSTSASSGTSDTHASRVAWVAAGSIMEGQDTDWSGTVDRERRSGVAWESVIYFYLYDQTSAGRKAAMQRAIADGIDVLNLSAGSIECEDAPNNAPESYDPSSGNETVTAALAAGIVMFKSAGNGHEVNETCSISYPGWRPEFLSVGALDTPGATTTDDAFLRSSSGRGASRVGYENGTWRIWSHPSVALTAPGCIERYPNSDSGFDGDSGGTTTRCGSSYAAPAAAGSAALLFHAFRLPSGFPSYTRTAPQIFTNMLLMGDGWYTAWDGDLDENYGVEDTSAAEQMASPGSGFGKLRMHYPGSGDPTMGSSSTWKWTIPSARTVTQGVNTWWPAHPNSSWNNTQFPATATHFKWAFSYFPSDMDDYGSMGMEVWEASCSSSNPLTGTLRAYDWSTSNRKRIQMFGSDIAGKCLWLVIKPYYTPGSSITVHNAFYYHSGNTALH